MGRWTPAVAAALALALAGCGAAQRASPRPRPPRPAAVEARTRDAAALKASTFRAAAALEARRAARRRAELRRLRRSTTVEAALRVALLTHRLTPSAHARLRAQWAAAQAAVLRLPGARGQELASVVGTVRALAARHALTSDRLDPMFLILRRNTAFWSRAPMPAPHWRTTFGADPAVFQYYPGQGLQLQPLASWGRVNALAHICLDRPRSCPTRELRRRLDRLVDLAARRDGYLAWEYYFAFGGGTPPWVSGMTQATAVQALARGYRALGIARWRRVAVRALGAFEHGPPDGVAVAAPGGRHYLMYSFAPGIRILNGDLQAVTGLRDLAVLGRSRRAGRLYRRGERAARRAVAAFDTGAWSLYSARGLESTLGYHDLVAGFLGGLCRRVRATVYCRTAARFHRYEREPTRIALGPLRGLRVHRPVVVRFSLSKVSRVRVRLWGVRGLSLARDFTLAHGAHALVWTPPRHGRFRLRIEAQGPSGPLGVSMRTLSVARPKPKHARRHRHGRRRKALIAAATPDESAQQPLSADSAAVRRLPPGHDRDGAPGRAVARRRRALRT